MGKKRNLLEILISEFEQDQLKEIIHDAVCGGDAELALTTLREENEKLKVALGSNPMMAVTGDLFDRAELLKEHGWTLACYFNKTDKPELEERALQLRCQPILTAHTHRRNLVGPVMLDWANCNKRIGRVEKADELYHAIVSDFQVILGWGPTFNEDWMTAVRCMQQALENSSRDYGDLKTRTSDVLSKSEQMALERDRKMFI